ncbi:MAG: M48 family metalloprotease [Elusimicrobia bacterium]|nr:M48 family metalloprotease [Elusimicrobiota bacterium]
MTLSFTKTGAFAKKFLALFLSAALLLEPALSQAEPLLSKEQGKVLRAAELQAQKIQENSGQEPQNQKPSEESQEGLTEREKEEEKEEFPKELDPSDPRNDANQIGNRRVDQCSSGVGLPGDDWNSYSREDDIKIGAIVSKEYEDNELKPNKLLLEDPIVSRYIQNIAEKIREHSDWQTPFTVKVIKSDVINAFAFPGGYLYFNAGLVLYAPDEAALAGVMAHEIAHVTVRHGSCFVSKATRMGWARFILENVGYYLLQKIGILGGAIGRTVGERLLQLLKYYGISWLFTAEYAGFVLAMLKYSRANEKMADHYGMQYLWAAGYDTSGFTRMFKVMQREDKRPKISPLWMSHPPTEDRVAYTQRVTKYLAPAWDRGKGIPNSSYLLNTSCFVQVKQRLWDILAGKPSERYYGVDPICFPTQAGEETLPGEKKKEPEKKGIESILPGPPEPPKS